MQLLEEDFRRSIEPLQDIKGRKLRRGEAGDVPGYHHIILVDTYKFDGSRVTVGVGADIGDMGADFDYYDLRHVRIGGRKQDLDMRILTPGNLDLRDSQLVGRNDLVSHKSYSDIGFKGNLLGPNDVVSITKRDLRKTGWEEFSSGGSGGYNNGSYNLDHWRRTGDCKGYRHIFDETLCNDGQARGDGYHFREELPPHGLHRAKGIYAGMTRPEAQVMVKREREVANVEYRRILSRIVQDLAKQVKSKENLTR